MPYHLSHDPSLTAQFSMLYFNTMFKDKTHQFRDLSTEPFLIPWSFGGTTSNIAIFVTTGLGNATCT